MTSAIKLYPTRNDLSEDTRRRVVSLLQARLSDALDLEAQMKQAHWNVRGPAFFQLHQLFDAVHDEVEEHVDMLAERITALGAIADGDVRTTARSSTLAPYPSEPLSAESHIERVAAALGAFGATTRAAIDTAAGLDDAGSADLLTEISRAIDKQLWLVEAHHAG